MEFWVYILYSNRQDSFYKGQTSNLSRRIGYHNGGYEISTKTGVPWVLVWSTCKPTRAEALSLERKLKNLSRLRLLEFMLKYSDSIPDGSTAQLIQRLLAGSSH